MTCLAGWFGQLNWGTVPDWIVAATAIITALYAAHQLKLVRIARQDSVEGQKFAASQRQEYLKIQQGLQLMEIDKQYEGVLQPSRKALLALRRKMLKAADGCVDGNHSARISDYLRELREKSSHSGAGASDKSRQLAVDEYFCLTQLPNYIETMGVLVNEGLVDEAALLRLYDGMIARVIGDVLPHIHWRRGEDKNPGYLIFAEALHTKAVAHMQSADT